jgi:iron complex outermembrane recepter protein
MKQLFKNQLLYLAMFLMVSASTFAQGVLKGTVTDSQGVGIPGSSISIVGTRMGGSTGVDGTYSIKLPDGTYEVRFSSVGYNSLSKAVIVSGETISNAMLEISTTSLDEVVISTGSRGSQRVVTDAALPVDIISAKDLKIAGQPTFDKALQYTVPSFNVVNTPVNDATTLLDPWELRNMGPSRTLILINGKRKNLSSLLYVQFSPGRGETGVDISAIPQQAIQRVEILRDGASAQYGSDAIAGVMNIILKDKYDYTSVNLNTGVTAKGDGGMYGVSLNSGSNFGAGKGFVNYTVDFTQQNSAVRSTKIDVPTEIATFGNAYGEFKDLDKFKKEKFINYDGTKINPKGAAATIADMNLWNTTRLADNNTKYNTIISKYLKDYPTGGNINGTGETTAGKFLVNFGIPTGLNSSLYGNAAMIVKRVKSFANFRTPYWRQDRGLLHSPTDNKGVNYIESPAQLAFDADAISLYKGYIGYVPTFEGDMVDYNGTLGAKGETNGWKHDASLTFGGNTQAYTVDNTVNRGLGTASPTRFKPGGYGFSHIVGNIDVSKAVTEKLGIAFGIEARSEKYTIVAGDEASYTGQGSNSFPGINPLNAGDNQRFNIGAYADLSYDISKDFLINGTIRTENYSDFGTANVWKLSSRYKLLNDKIVFRGSLSTGFRAPTLHQIYAQSVQAAFVGGTIQLSGLFNNKSAQARALGIPALRPEKSDNITLGLGLNLTKNLSITFDYYNIKISDRIVYSSSISSEDETSTLGKILSTAGVKTVQFFINGIQTKNSGIDFVASYKNIGLGRGKLGLNLAGNVVLQNKILGLPQDPPAIKAAESSILNVQIKSLLTESRPNYKVIFGGTYAIKKWNINLNNTLFGSTSFQDLDNGGSDMKNIKATFTPAVVSDLSIGYEFSDKVSFTANANNLFNILPKWDLKAINADGEKAIKDPAAKSLLRGFLGFSGRYDILGYNGSQFSQLGTVFNANLNIKF